MADRTVVIDERWPLPARKLASLVQQLLKVGKTQAERLIQQGNVRVNGRTVTRTNAVLEIGDRLEVHSRDEVNRPELPRFGSSQRLKVVYQDDSLVVVEKPPGLLSVPTPKRESHTLLSQLTRQLRDEGEADELCSVHRLDRGVSGLLVFAKRVEIAERLRDQFAERKPKRLYSAIVAGRIRDDDGVIRSYLATDDKLNRYSTDDPEGGELAITHFRVTERFDDATVVELALETGRRNQIRVHMAEAGHPVLGDARYGGDETYRIWRHGRLALHARTLGFQHPLTGTPLLFHSPLPREMSEFGNRRPRQRDRE